MQVLGLLVRTRCDAVTEIGFRHAEEILQESRNHGHIFIDVAAEMATKDNVLRIIDGIGCPSGSFLKLLVFYCHGNVNSPIDQNGQDFIDDKVFPKFANWGVYCIGCDVGQTLGHRLLSAGAHFLIAFNSSMSMVLPHADEIYKGLNSGILRILQEGIGPSAATEHMRQYFLNSVAHIDATPDNYSLERKLALVSHAKALVYYGVDSGCSTAMAQPRLERLQETRGASLIGDLASIETGAKHASAYQELVAKILHQFLFPELDEPLLEVSNESGSARYDIVFMNRADAGFWHDIKVSRGNWIVIFDAKNKKALDPSDADQMLRYSGQWRGSVVFTVCREKPTRRFTTRAADLLKEHNVCLIVLSDEDLLEMDEIRRKGNNPTIVVERLFRERVARA